MVSVFGSLSYMLDENGDPDWELIDDIDLRVHLSKPSSHAQRGLTRRLIEEKLFARLEELGFSVDRENKLLKEKDGDGYFIRDSIIIVPKDGIIRDGTVI